MRKIILFVSVLATVLSISHAWWRCHECMDSLTLNLEVTGERYAGTDNEAIRSRKHSLDMMFFCNKRAFNRTEFTEMASNFPLADAITPATNLSVPPFVVPTVIGFEAVPFRVPLMGLILKGQSRTYRIRLPAYLKRICECIKPINFRKAVIRARNADGIDIKSASIYANFEDSTSSILTIDHHFDAGFIDTSDYPQRDAKKFLTLFKAGC